MKKILLIGAICCTSGMMAQTVTLDESIQGQALGMSPDGKMVVGCSSTWGDDLFKSFVYNTATKEIEWRTSYDQTDYDKSGRFTAVTNSGIIAGSMKNKDMLIEVAGGGEFKPGVKKAKAEDVTHVPLVTAAVWRNGKTYKLGTGGYTVSEFSSESDGSYAVGISEDGNIVAGYIFSAWYEVAPIGWKYNENTDTYEHFMYTLPAGASIGTIKSLSADGSVAAGTCTVEGTTYATVWTSPTAFHVLDLGQESASAFVSRNGKYVLVYGTGYSGAALSIYEVETDKLLPVSLPDNAIAATGATIADNGDITCQIMDNVTWGNTMYFYSKQNGTITDMDSYLKLLGGNVNSLNSLQAVSTSADGLTLAGASFDNSWVLHLPQTEVVTVNAPKGVEIFYNSTSEVTVLWNAVNGVPEGITVTGYQVYLNNELVETVKAEQATDGVLRCKYPATLGSLQSVYVKTVAMSGNKEITSAESATATVRISADTSLIFYYNFNDASLDANNNIYHDQDTWTALSTDNTELINWSFDASDFENNTPFLATTAITTTPWESILLSRFFDATDATKAFFQFFMKFNIVNLLDQDLSQDYLDVEYSFNGEDWQIIKSYRASDLKLGTWNNYIMPLPQEVFGKQFQLRLNAHGKSMVKWYVDNIGISDNYWADVPTGLRAISTSEDKVELIWHNSIGTYELSYLENSNVLIDYCTGSEGQPLISAIELDAKALEPHIGEYISSVSTFIYDDPNLNSTLKTKAEAIVYVDNEVATRETFRNEFNQPYTMTVALSSPVKIEAGKTYRVAIRIYDYDSKQTPVYYQSSQNFIAGKTDLYSEDEGKTWQKLSDFYTGENEKLGQCIWPIRANITAEALTDGNLLLDPDLFAYNIYRNGELLNESAIYAARQCFVDNAPLQDANYTIQAFYTTGIISPVSEELNINLAGVESVATKNLVTVSPNPASDVIRIDGNFDNAQLVNLKGQKVAVAKDSEIQVSNLEAGIYFVSINTGNAVETHKVIIRR